MMKIIIKRNFEVRYSFMKLFSWNLEILAQFCDVIISKLNQKVSNLYKFKFASIALVQKIFSDGKNVEFWNINPCWNWNYQGRTYIWGAFFNFLKLQKVLNTNSAGYLTEELLSNFKDTCFYRTPLVAHDKHKSILQ